MISSRLSAQLLHTLGSPENAEELINFLLNCLVSNANLQFDFNSSNEFIIGTSDLINSSNQTVNIRLISGNALGLSSTGGSGFLAINSGAVEGSGSSGGVVVQSGDNIGSGQTADVSFISGASSNNVSGSVNISAGNSNSSSKSGSILIASGHNAGTGSSGDFTVETQNSLGGSTGTVSFNTGDTLASNTNSGGIDFITGTGQKKSGKIDLNTGVSGTDDSGGINLTTGRMSGIGSNNSGSITLTTGDINHGVGGQTGNINLIVPTPTSLTATRGKINLTASSIVAPNIEYIPADASKWVGSPPATLKEAIDRIAAALGPIA